MTGTRWRRIERLYHEALERPRADRTRFLHEACGDDSSLGREVASLVAADDESTGFLVESAISMAAADLSEGSAAALVGQRLGSYELLSHVGSGGMGDVYRARDVRLDRYVAVKVLAPRLACDAEFLDRFAREARTISHLSHRNICALHDVGREEAASPDGTAIHYLVLEFLEGDTLAERLRTGPLPLQEALPRGIEICDALAHAHRHGIAHGDLKPGNVILTESGAMLVDFGLGSRPADSRRVLGTLQYMAPEQIRGGGVDPRADIWAFGAVFYEMLTGRRAFSGTTEAAIVGGILDGEPAPLQTCGCEAPDDIARLIRVCLAKARAGRHLTAQEIAARLRGIAETATPRHAASPDSRGSNGTHGRWAVVALIGVTAVAAALIVRPASPRSSQTATPSAGDVTTASRSASAQLLPVVATAPVVSGTDRDLADVTTSSIEAYRYYAEGMNLHERGRDGEATAQLLQAVRIDPTFAMALAKLAITETAPGYMDMAAARRHSQRAFELAARLPERERLYVEGVYRRYHGDLQGSIESFKSVLAIAPDHISSRQTLAVTYAGLERYREAAGHFEELRRRGVPLGISYFGLSQTYQALGQFDKAIDVVREFLVRNPDDARAYRRLGEALVAAGRLDEATLAADRADGLAGRPRANEDLRRIILLLQDRVAEAEAADRARLKKGDTSVKGEDSFRLASDLLFRGQAGEARKLFAAAGIRDWVALLWLEQGDAARALAEIQRGLPAGRDRAAKIGPEGLTVVARAHARLGHRAESAAAIEQMASITDRMPPPFAERLVHWARGASALELHDAVTATRELRQAAALLPPNPMERGIPMLYSLGCAYLAAGQDLDAAAMFESLVGNSARAGAPLEYVRSLYFLGQIAQRRGDAASARGYYERFVRYWGAADLDRDRVADARRKLASAE